MDHFPIMIYTMQTYRQSISNHDNAYYQCDIEGCSIAMLATLATFLKQSVVLRGPGHNDCLDPSPFGHLDVSENAKLWPFMDPYGKIMVDD